MNSLIEIYKTEIDSDVVNSANARDIYSELGIKKDFSSWIKQQIDRLCLVENKDYIVLTQEGEKKIEYIVTVEAGKNIALVSFTNKGQEVRDYFIQVEKESKAIELPSKLELAQMVIESETKVLELEHRIEEKDKVIIAVADLNIKAGEVTVGDFSKNLAIDGLGQNNLFKWLKGRGFLMHNTAPYQQYVDRGYFKRKPNGTHNGEVRYITMLTPKGTVWLTKMLKAEFELED